MSKDTSNIYKYFIISMNEYFNSQHFALENRKFDSISYLLGEYLKLDVEIKKNISDRSKLQNGRKALLNNIVFYFQNTLFTKNKIFKRDIDNLLSVINSKNSDERKQNNEDDNKNKGQEKIDNDIFYSISALYKKITNINILDYWIDIIIENSKTYDDVDKVMDCYINELLYEGYSLRYLKEWWTEKFKGIFGVENEEVLLENIKKFKELSSKQHHTYNILVKYNLPDKLKNEVKEKHSIKISNVNYKEINENIRNQVISSKSGNNKFFESSKVTYFSVEISACDKYKAIESAIYPLKNYIEVYKFIDKTISAVDITTYMIKENGIFNEEPLSNISRYLRESTEREKEDIEDFIKLREELRSKNEDMASIYDIESVINLIQKSSEFTMENRLLNTWSCIENLVRFYSGNSIIEKVINIIPQVICMYVVKQKMNVLWDVLYPLMDKKIVDERLTKCKLSEQSNKYISEKLAEYLVSEKCSGLYENTKPYITINRKLSEINKLLKDPKELLKYINTMEESITHSINSIYRTRNDLVHNGGKLESYMENQICSLQYYLNCLLGTLIFHIKRNPKLIITEILYSIVYSYKTYKNELKELKDEIDKRCKDISKQKEKYKSNEEELKRIESELIEEREKTILNFGVKNIVYSRYLYI